MGTSEISYASSGSCLVIHKIQFIKNGIFSVDVLYMNVCARNKDILLLLLNFEQTPGLCSRQSYLRMNSQRQSYIDLLILF